MLVHWRGVIATIITRCPSEGAEQVVATARPILAGEQHFGDVAEIAQGRGGEIGQSQP
jgi:hypothetical protein